MYFNSRPHEEVDEYPIQELPDIKNFNSRPHEEVDDDGLISSYTILLFQLTTSRRGRLSPKIVLSNSRNISTHDLTKRSTIVKRFAKILHIYFNSRPHEEVDYDFTILLINVVTFQLTTSRRGRHGWQEKYEKLKEFQLTTSRRGRQELDEQIYSRVEISTHDLTKRSTVERLMED